MRRRASFVVLSVLVIIVTATTTFWSTRRGQDDQCDRPVAERTGGWFCYEPGDVPPSPGTG
jgi:hypothetical protein